ncbi:hypothetical protein ARALYDRAFT_356097 [Arabidopsis lyrata subsp. lyrata]|uniref:Uncharacterized protein n=1 Tax=Arabidopsis lyrata subsp. lyrata TaxID=81972 RepID=D7MJT0_ARALL|nr:hypothetical protein ARALYDRAFT_356097 [Arabidopsis lyrata subsp. lyrata]
MSRLIYQPIRFHAWTNIDQNFLYKFDFKIWWRRNSEQAEEEKIKPFSQSSLNSNLSTCFDGSDRICDRGLRRSPATFSQPYPLLNSISKSKKEVHTFPSGALSHKSEPCLIDPPRYSSSRPLPEGSTHQQMLFSVPILGMTSPVMLAAVYGRAPQTRGMLGFPLLDWTQLGPIDYISRPITKSCNPTSHFAWPRSAFLNFLLSPSSLTSRYSDLTGRGLQLSPMSLSLRWVCNYISRTLAICKSAITSSFHQSFRLIDLLSLVSRYVNRLKNNGIMISSLRRGDYRNFFNLFSMFPLNTESEQVLSYDYKVDIHEIKGWRNFGIMIPFPWNGGYQSFLNFLPPNPPDDRTSLTSLLADEQIQLAILVPARTSAMEPYSTSLSLLTVTIVSSNASFVDDSSTNRVITCTNLLHSFGLQALMDPLSNYFCYLCVAFALTFVCCCYFFLSLLILVPLATLNLVSFE